MTESDSAALVGRYSTAPTLEQLPRPISLDGETPPNPPEQVQVKFVGASYEGAYKEAAAFVDAVDGFAAAHCGGGLAGVSRLIDFGSGWGRISRMLLRWLPSERIYAFDVDHDMTALMNVTLPGINAVTVSAEPPTAMGDAAFRAAVAFSVFSHLSGPAHEAWAAEFGRLVAPGGFVAITVLEEVFLGQVAGAQAAVAAGAADGFATRLAECFPDLDAARAGFARGEIQFAGVGGGEIRSGEYYGWAAAPRAYVERVWGRNGFQVVEWVPSGELFSQALVFLVRGNAPVSAPRAVALARALPPRVRGKARAAARRARRFARQRLRSPEA